MKTHFISETRKDFFEHWKSIHKDLVVPKYSVPAELKCFEQLVKQNHQGFFIANLIELRFEHVFELPLTKYVNHPPNKYITDGYEYTWQQMHRDYMDFNIQGYRRLLYNTFQRYDPQERLKIEVFWDFLYKVKENSSEYTRLLQHIKIIESDNSFNPIFTINLISDINFLKRKEDSTFAIKLPDKKVFFYKYSVQTKTVFDFGAISEREFAVLKLLARGLSSRQIADMLFISPNTVDTHRRNLLEMTNCVDTTALIVYCRLLGII